MTILSIINELGATASRLDKEAILNREKNNALLKKVILSTLDPFRNYYIKKIPDYVPNKGQGISLNFAIDSIGDLAKRIVTGHDGIAHLKYNLEALNEDDAKVLELIIQRDLKCGVSVATVNKIWKGLIAEFDVCLAHKDTSFINFPAFAQIKMDGARGHLVWNGVEAKIYSRAGKVFELGDVFNDTAKRLMSEGEVWDGELLFYEGNKAMPRKQSNGLANKSLKGTITEEEASKAVFVVWDIVDTSSSIPYDKRFSELEKRFTQPEKKFRLCLTKIVESDEEAQNFFNEMIMQGEEGAILKNFDFVWEPKRVKGVGKMKAEEEADLIVVDWEEGTGKNKGKLGALVCETSDSKLRVNVGIGFSDSEREVFTKEYVQGQIVTVIYNQIIDNKADGVKSLFLPRFVEFRIDKKKANSINELK